MSLSITFCSPFKRRFQSHFVHSFVGLKRDFHNFFRTIMQSRHFTEINDFKTHFFLLLVLFFEDRFRFLMLFLNKYVNINRIKAFDLNTVKEKKAVFNRFFRTKFYL